MKNLNVINNTLMEMFEMQKQDLQNIANLIIYPKQLNRYLKFC